MSERFKVIETRIEGPILIEPRVFGDERGFFTETYRRNEFAELGINEEMVQDNHSRSSYGIVRGMHFQIGRGAAKLVRCGRGAIVDVMVDLRKGSPTYGEWEAFELSDENGRMRLLPRRLRARLLRDVRDRRRLLQAGRVLQRRAPSAGSPSATRTSASSGRSRPTTSSRPSATSTLRT